GLPAGVRVEPLGQVERPELRGPDGAVEVAEGLEILIVEIERADLDGLLDRDEVAVADFAGEDLARVGLQCLFPLVAVDELPERCLDFLRCVPDARADFSSGPGRPRDASRGAAAGRRSRRTRRPSTSGTRACDDSRVILLALALKTTKAVCQDGSPFRP